MNTNLFHNILNIGLALVAVLSLPEVMALIPADYGLAIAGGIGALKVIINTFRDGITGLASPQPPVEK